jgi:beta-glucanase (GH16 family)
MGQGQRRFGVAPGLHSISTAFFVSLSLTLAVSAPPLPPPPPGYALVAALSDEFDGDALDLTKWAPRDEGWLGRQPGLFDPANVVVSSGALQLWARNATRNASWPAGYDNYTTAAVHSLSRVRLGFFEIRWRSGSSAISSSWWLHEGNGSAWTEIDVFETTGVTNPAKFGANQSDLPSHVHIFELPDVPVPSLPAACNCSEGTANQAPCSKGNTFRLPSGASFADDFHVASLNWTLASVTISLDGAVVSVISSPCLVEEIGMDFDRETMPGWMALPPTEELPDSPFLVDYVRSYQLL